jgi:outer membrane protein assembly factor BamB
VRDREILFFGTGDADKPEGWSSAILYRLRDDGDRATVLTKQYSNFYPTGGPVFGPGDACGYQHFGAEVGGFIVYRWAGEKGSFQFLSGDLTDSRATPSIRGDRYFFADRTGLVCANPSDGKEKENVLWQSGGWPYYGPNGFHSSPALSQKHVVAGCDDGRVYFFDIDFAVVNKNRIQKPVWVYETEGVDKVNGAVTSSPAIADGGVYFGGEDGILYGLGRGEPCKTIESVDLKSADNTEVSDQLSKPLEPHEWRTAGGDMGFSGVSPTTLLKPPLRIKWRTRLWGSFKGSMIVADGKVFAASRSGTLSALDAQTGEILWKTRHTNSQSWATSTYADGKLLVLRGNSAGPRDQQLGGGLWCHEAGTGKVLWRKTQPIPTGAYDFSAGAVVYQGTALGCWHVEGGTLECAAFDLATGDVVWSKRHEKLLPAEGRGEIHVSQGCLGENTWFCSISRLGNRGEADPAKGQVGVTLAVNPTSGALLWKNGKYFVGKESRVCYRKRHVVVFDGWNSSAHALDPKTGDHRWSARVNSTQMNALTDAFLESQGKQDVSGAGFCGYHVYANGVFYGTKGFSQAHLVARMTKDRGEMPVIWKFPTMSRSCPAPAPAYGRLYYAANCEGVVYCFENETSPQ